MERIIANKVNRRNRIMKIRLSTIFTVLFSLILMSGTAWATYGVADFTTCGACHGSPPLDGTRSSATGAVVGSHTVHVSEYAQPCTTCHPSNTTYNHRNGNIETNASLTMPVSGASGTYSRGTSFAQSINPTTGTCTTTYCHSNGTNLTTPASSTSPQWGVGTTNCTSCHTYPPNYANGTPKKNSHAAHRAWNTGDNCSVCHSQTTTVSSTITNTANHVKKSYSVVTSPTYTLANFTYTYAADGGTCGTTFCHADQTPKWGSIGYSTSTTGNDWNCVSCHSYAFPKRLGGLTTIRKVVGADADFNMTTISLSRHLFGATTVTKWDCIVCHGEGAAFTAGALTAGKVNWEKHNDTGGLIHLRNVDVASDTGGWAINNKSFTPTDYTNMDTFCLGCHDSNGASAVYVTNTNTGIGGTGSGSANGLAPFNSTDWTTTAYGIVDRQNGGWSTVSGEKRLLGSSEIMWNGIGNNGNVRTRVVDVKTQFYAGTAGNWATTNYNGNPSQHAVLGTRYGKKHAQWYTQSGLAWGTVVLKRLGTSLREYGETALLSCADCHILDTGSGAHGGTKKAVYNLTWVTNDIDALCQKCHAPPVYNINAATGAAGVSRFNHVYSARAGTWKTRWGWGTIPGIASAAAGSSGCMVCHAGFNPSTTVSRRNSYGGIHGTWGTATLDQTGTYGFTTINANTVTAYRFFPGVYLRTNPNNQNTDLGWNTVVTASTTGCYFVAANNSFSQCVAHAGAANFTGTYGTGMYSRPTKY